MGAAQTKKNSQNLNLSAATQKNQSPQRANH